MPTNEQLLKLGELANAVYLYAKEINTPAPTPPAPTPPAPTPPAPTPPPAPVWAPLAQENQTFTVPGTRTVRYGSGTNWVERNVTNVGQCTNTFFGRDPAPGVVKVCQVSSIIPPPSPTPPPPSPTPPPPSPTPPPPSPTPPPPSPTPPPPSPTPPPPSPGMRLGLNAGGVAYWLARFPFVNMFHCVNDIWGRGTPAVAWNDADGWPANVPPGQTTGVLLFHDLNIRLRTRPYLKPGEYVIRRTAGNMTAVPSGLQYTTVGNEVRFRLTGNETSLTIRCENRTTDVGSFRGTVFFEGHRPAVDSGAHLNPDWVAFYRAMPQLKFIRLMDMLCINHNPIVNEEDFCRIEEFSWCNARGMPPALAGHVAVATGHVIWMPTPHMATPQAMGAWYKAAADVSPGRIRCIPEYGNEVWNFQFPAFNYCRDVKSVGLTIVGNDGRPSLRENDRAGCAYALGCIQAWDAATLAFGGNNIVDRVAGGHPEWWDLMGAWPMFNGGEAGRRCTGILTTMYWQVGQMADLIRTNAGANDDAWWIAQLQRVFAERVVKYNEELAHYRRQGVLCNYYMYEGGDHHSDFDNRWQGFQANYDLLNNWLNDAYLRPLGAEIFRMGVECARSLGMNHFAKFVDFGDFQASPNAKQISPFGAGRPKLDSPTSPVWAYLMTLS